jgi:predicted flap endonuclease-1-like 5' DNA nuclease
MIETAVGELTPRERHQLLRAMVDDLERAQFGDPDDRERLMEVRALTIRQLEDDSDTQKRDQVGRAKVESFAWALEQSDLLYPARTPDQFALEEGLQPLLESALTGEQRVLVRWRYAAMYTHRQIAALSNTSHQAVDQRLNTVHRRLREMLLAAFGPTGDLTEEVSQ